MKVIKCHSENLLDETTLLEHDSSIEQRRKAFDVAHVFKLHLEQLIEGKPSSSTPIQRRIQKNNHLRALLINGKSGLSLVGVPVMKEFKIGWFEGTITSFLPEYDLYHIVYTDGDIEDHDYNDLESFVDTYK